MKHLLTGILLLSTVSLRASVFNDVLSARLAGSEPPVAAYVNPFTPPEVDATNLGGDLSQMLDSKANYVKRAEVASKVKLDHLEVPERDAVIAWLAYSPPTEGNAFSVLSEMSLKNDMLVRYIESDADREAVGRLMLHVVHDSSQSPLWREYVLQHFVVFYEATWGDAEAGHLDDLRDAFQSVLANCLFEDSALCGTSVINLLYLCETCPEFDDTLVLQAAERIAADTSTRPESRISALQLLGETGGLESTRIAAVVINEAPRPNAGVRLAALGVLKLQPLWHAEVASNLETFLTTSTHGRLRRLARKLLENPKP